MNGSPRPVPRELPEPTDPRVYSETIHGGSLRLPPARSTTTLPITQQRNCEEAEVLRRNLADLAVDVVVSAFEDWTLPERPVDAVVAFTSRQERRNGEKTRRPGEDTADE